jgi:hypothetical protein
MAFNQFSLILFFVFTQTLPYPPPLALEPNKSVFREQLWCWRYTNSSMGNRNIQRGFCYRMLVRPSVCLTCVLADCMVGGSCLRSRLQVRKVWETSESAVPNGNSPQHSHRNFSPWCHVDERENVICLFII